MKVKVYHWENEQWAGLWDGDPDAPDQHEGDGVVVRSVDRAAGRAVGQTFLLEIPTGDAYEDGSTKSRHLLMEGAQVSFMTNTVHIEGFVAEQALGWNHKEINPDEYTKQRWVITGFSTDQ